MQGDYLIHVFLYYHFRRLDFSSQGFNSWPFMTTHNWYENPRGTWTLEVDNSGSSPTIG